MNRKVIGAGVAVIVLGVGVLAFVALGTAIKNRAQTARRFDQPIPVQVAAAVEGDLTEVISAPVTLRPLTERVVNPQITARVTAVLVKVGDVVEQGQVLARLDATGMMEEVLRAGVNVTEKQTALKVAAAPTRAELIEQARIAVQQARQAAEFGKLHWEQQKEYAEKRVKAAEAAVSAVAAAPRPPLIDEAKAAIESAQQVLRQTNEQVEQAQVDVQQAETAVKQARSDHNYWQKILETKRDLYGQKLIARQDVDDAEKSYTAANTQWQLAQMNVRRSQANLRAVQANRDRAAADVKRAQENLNVVLLGPKPEDVQRAKEDLEQVKHAAKMDVASARQNYEDAQKKHEAAQQELRLRLKGPRPEEVDLSRAQLSSALTNAQIAKAQLRKVVVLSPANGMVTARNVDPGEIVSPSGPPAANTIPGQPPAPGVKLGAGLFSIAETSSMDAVAQVEEAKIKQVRVEQRVDVTLDAFPTETFRGAVRLVESNANPTTRTFSVFVALSKVRPDFYPNMQGVARLYASRRALMVPSMALTTSPQKPLESTVFVVEDGQARLRRVRAGAMQDGKTEILEGLRTGERVAVYDLSQLRDGDRVAFNTTR